MIDGNIEALFKQPGSHDDICQQVAALRSMVISLCQDVAVLKEMLSSHDLWDENAYKRLRMQRMVADHSSLGCDSLQAYSYYPYMLDEQQFLRRSLACDEQEVRQYEADVDEISRLT